MSSSASLLLRDDDAQQQQQHTLLDPADIYFTFSRIRPRFSCGRRVLDTLEQLTRGELRVHDVPLLCVLTDGKAYYSLNNRRLYVYKQLRERGVVSRVPVRLRPVPHTRRMMCKYTPDKCSRTATLMRERDEGDSSGKADEQQHDGEDEDGNAAVASTRRCAAAQQQQQASLTAAAHGKRSARQRRALQQQQQQQQSRSSSSSSSLCSLERELRELHLHAR